MATVKKYTLFGIFISILAIFAMSHNVSAVSPVIDLSNYELVSRFYSTPINCAFVNFSNTTTSGNNYCRGQVSGSGTAGITYLLTNETYQVKQNDILTFNLMVFSQNPVNSELNLELITNQNLGWNFLDLKVLDTGKLSVNEYGSGNINIQGVNYDINLDYYEGFRYYKFYEITLLSLNNNDKQFGITTTTGNSILSIKTDDAFGSYFKFTMTNYKLWRFTGSKENQEQEQKTQEAVDASETSGGNSSTDAQQGSASLLSAIGGFFSAITSASPTNCVFNAPLNTHFGNQRLNVDLCALTLPSQIGALTSIIAIGILIPFAIHMFKKFIGLFRSFQS